MVAREAGCAGCDAAISWLCILVRFLLDFIHSSVWHSVLSISFVHLTRPHPSAFLLTDCELLSGTWSSRADVGRLRRLFDV